MPTPPLLTIHTDGASRGNPGAAAYAYLIARDGESDIEEAGCLGEMTNNQAEYTALVRALRHALELGPNHRLLVQSDSELMVKQVNGQYKVKNAELRPLYEEARGLIGQFTGGVTLRHIPRERNSRADALGNEALDGKRESLRDLEALVAAHRPAPPATPSPTPARKGGGFIKVKAEGRLESPALLRTNDGDLELDVGSDRDLQGQAQRLIGKDVVVSGRLTLRPGGAVVRVESLYEKG